MDWKLKIDDWLTHLPIGDPLHTELEQTKSDTLMMEDAFYKDLAFGTGGMRGIMGPGTNRLNIYTVRKAAYGLARYISEQGTEAMSRGVAISYDSRHMSKEFAYEVARTLGQQGIHAYLFEDLRPTPLLSFAVSELQAYAGVMVTASHNPPQYNGLKIYGEDGAQLPPEAADRIINYMAGQSELAIEVADITHLEKDRLLTYIGNNIDVAYIHALDSIRLNRDTENAKLSVIFSALHGTATEITQQAFSAYGFSNVRHVFEQGAPDPNFTTVKSPNPEEPSAFQLAIQYGLVYEADLLLATDPDADRLGVQVRNNEGKFVHLTGNQIASLMLEYKLEQLDLQGALPRNGVILKSIVSSELAKAIGTSYGIETVDTLTGFKFIAEKISEYELTQERTFLYGFEESYGYLVGDFVRDKDAIQSAIFMVEAASYYKQQGKSLYDVLIELYEKHGYYKEATRSITLEGKDGAEQIASIMQDFRMAPPNEVSGTRVITIEDYLTGISLDTISGDQTDMGLPVSDVLKYKLEDGSWISIRPSGTEPKCKFYFAVKAKTEDQACEKLATLESAVLEPVKARA